MQGTIGMFGHVSIRVPGTDQVFHQSRAPAPTRPRCGPSRFSSTTSTAPSSSIPAASSRWSGASTRRSIATGPMPCASCHLHAPHARALGIAGKQLKPVFLHGSFLCTGVPTWDNPRLVVNDDQAADLSRALGNHRVRADARPRQRRGRRHRRGGVFRLHVPGGERADPAPGRDHGRRHSADARRRRATAPQGTFNPRLFPLLWTYYERKVRLDEAHYPLG